MRHTSSQLAIALICLFFSSFSNADDFRKTNPHPSLDAIDVVKIVMKSLENNDLPYPNHGVEITYNFASPENKQITGPFSRFNKMIKGEAYRVMLNCKNIQYENYKIIGKNARLDVIFDSKDGQTYGFQFRLSRQVNNKYRDSWMTDSVMPIAITKT